MPDSSELTPVPQLPEEPKGLEAASVPWDKLRGCCNTRNKETDPVCVAVFDIFEELGNQPLSPAEILKELNKRRLISFNEKVAWDTMQIRRQWQMHLGYIRSKLSRSDFTIRGIGDGGFDQKYCVQIRGEQRGSESKKQKLEE